MEKLNSGNEIALQGSEALEKARKHFTALVKRLASPISLDEANKLTYPNRAEFNPTFSYPNLYELSSHKIAEKIGVIIANLAVVRDAEDNGYTPSVAEEFDKEKALSGLLNLNLLRIAQEFQAAEGEQKEELAKEFIELNEIMTGPIDESLYQGIINSMHELAERIPKDHKQAKRIADELLGMLPGQQGDERIISLPDEVFDSYQRVYKELFGEWINKLLPEGKEKYSDVEIASVFRRVLDDMGFEDWEVDIKEDVEFLSVNYKDKRVTVPINRDKTRAELAKKIVHEAGHIIRGWNGEQISKSAQNGLPDYLDAEEGLMSYGEEFISGKRQPNITYLERYLGVGSMKGALNDGVRQDFKAVFARMWRLRALMEYDIDNTRDITNDDKRKAKNESLFNAKRLFRGGDGCTPGVGWTKDKVYYEGYVKLTATLVDFSQKVGVENIDLLFLAKYDPNNELHKKYLGVSI